MIPAWADMSADDRKAVIAKHAADGLSAKQIALKFTGVTRNAIIGYCKRYEIKLHGTRAPSARTPTVPAPAAPASPPLRMPAREPAAKQVKSIPPAAGVASVAAPLSRVKAFEPLDGKTPVLLADLGAHQCHWPVNGLEGIEPIFCGARSSTLYCTPHTRLAYSPRGH